LRSLFAGSLVAPTVCAQECERPRVTLSFQEIPIASPQPATLGDQKTYPINLATALQLAGAQPLDIALASERVRLASAELDRARVLWLPTVYLGGDYFRHDGQLQDVSGNVFGTSKSTLMGGAGASAWFGITDAIFAPLAARQTLRARQALLQAAENDALLAVAEAYFGVQQARGELGGAMDAVRQTEELERRTAGLAAGLVPPLELSRVRAELARRRQVVSAARERWRTTSAELARILRLEPGVLVEPLEPPHLQVNVVDIAGNVDDLIALGLLNRPELAAQQALVRATLERLRQEKLRPLVPSLVLRGASTNPAGTLGVGAFGGGQNARIGDTSVRSDWDVEVLWELQNLGLGNRARIAEKKAEQQIAILEQFRVQDRIAAEVAQAFAQVQEAGVRVKEAQTGLREAQDSVAKNVEGLNQTRRVGDVILLVIRPQEAVAAVQAMGQAYADFYAAVADYDRAQFRLYRALGQPAAAIACR
jgi:outer membrane protein TolC